MTRFRTLLLAGIACVATAVLAVQAQVPGVNSTLNSVFTLVYDASTMKPTYSATQGPFTLATAATDVCQLYGSATKTVKVRRVMFGGIATAVAAEPVSILRRSAISTGGTNAIITNSLYDTANSAGTALAEFITANPTTLGEQAGVFADILYTYGNLTTGVGQGNMIVDFGALGSPIVLRGVAQSVAINLDVATIGGALITCTFEWTEDNDS